MRLGFVTIILCAFLTFGAQGTSKGTDPINLTYTMDASAFKQAVQDVADGIASGATNFSLYTMFQLAPNSPILSVLAEIPGAFKKLLEEVVFKKLAKISVDYTNQVVVLSGEYEISKVNVTGTGTIRFSSNLFLHNTAQTNVEGDKTLSASEAQTRLNKGLLNLANTLNESVALAFPKTFNVLDVNNLAAKIPEIGKDIASVSSFLKSIEGVLKGAAILAYTSQNYCDPRAGYLNVLGLNVVGQVNLDQKLNDTLAQKILDTVGATVTEGKGLWGHLVLPLSLAGIEGEIYLPCAIQVCPEMIAGKSCKGNPFLQTKRLRIGLKTMALGQQEDYQLIAYVASGVDIAIPWQKDPLEIDLKFSLSTDDVVQFQTDIENIDLAKLPKGAAIPVDIEHLMVTGGVSIALFMGVITTSLQTIWNIVNLIAQQLVGQLSIGGEEAAGVAGDAAIALSVIGALADPLAAVIEVIGGGAEEGVLDISSFSSFLSSELQALFSFIKSAAANIITPINNIGMAGEATIAGRSFDVEFCLFVDQTTNLIFPLIKIQLTKGQQQDFVDMATIVDIFYDLQKNQLDILEDIVGDDIPKFKTLISSILGAEEGIKNLADQALKGFKLNEAVLVISPLPGACGQDYYTFSTMEIQGSGTFLDVPFEGDITLNLGLDYLLAMFVIGEQVMQLGVGGIADLGDLADLFGNFTEIEDLISVLTTLGKVSWSTISLGFKTLSKLTSVLSIGAYLGQTVLSGIINIGIFVEGSLGKISAGPVTVSSKDGSKGPSLLVSLGFPTPLAAQNAFTPLIDTYVTGKIDIAVSPGFEADFEGTIEPLGFNVKADGDLGAFSTHLDAQLMLNKFLDSQFKFSVTGGSNALASSLASFGKNLANAGSQEVAKLNADLAAAQNLVNVAKSKLASTSGLVSSFDSSLKNCAAQFPDSGVIDTLNSIVSKGVLAVNPDTVTNQIMQYGKLGLDVGKLKAGIMQSINTGSELSKIAGLERRVQEIDSTALSATKGVS